MSLPVQFFQYIIVGVDLVLNYNRECNYSKAETTFWGGYDIGQFACIGSVYTKSPLALNVKLQTSEFQFIERIAQPFVSLTAHPSKLYFKSGYDMWGTPYYGGPAENFQIGTIFDTKVRVGVAIGSVDPSAICGYIKTSLFVQADLDYIKLNSDGSDFVIDKSFRPSFGVSVSFGVQFPKK